MPGSPVIKSLADLQRARSEALISTKEAQANMIHTFKQERAKRMEEARDSAEDRALTVEQRKREASKMAQQDAQMEQESIAAVMPQSQVVRTDPKGIEASASTSAAGNIGVLAEILGGGGASVTSLGGGQVSGGMPAMPGNPLDPLGLNATNPIAGGRIGVDYSVDPKSGMVTQTSRDTLRTGLGGLDAVNALVGALRGGKPLLTTKEVVERPDMVRQRMLDEAAARDAILQGEANARQEARTIEADRRAEEAGARAERQVAAREGQLGVAKQNLGLAREKLTLDQQKFLHSKGAEDRKRVIADVYKTRDLELAESKDWLDRNKGFFEARQAIEGVSDLAKEAAKGNSSAGVQLVYAAAKAQDPRISNQDFQYMANSGSLEEKLQGMYTKALTGDLTERMIGEITAATRANMIGQERSYRAFKKQNEARLRAQGLNPENILIDPLPAEMIEIPTESPIPAGARILGEEK